MFLKYAAWLLGRGKHRCEDSIKTVPLMYSLCVEPLKLNVILQM